MNKRQRKDLSIAQAAIFGILIVFAISTPYIYFVGFTGGQIDLSSAKAWVNFANYFGALTTPILSIFAIYMAYRQLKHMKNQHGDLIQLQVDEEIAKHYEKELDGIFQTAVDTHYDTLEKFEPLLKEIRKQLEDVQDQNLNGTNCLQMENKRDTSELANRVSRIESQLCLIQMSEAQLRAMHIPRIELISAYKLASEHISFLLSSYDDLRTYLGLPEKQLLD